MKNTKHLILTFTALVLCFTVFATTSSPASVSAAEPIPYGCPGSKIQGVGPGKVDCSKIPYGCPGSSVPFGTPPTSLTVCKYDANATPKPYTPVPSTGGQLITPAKSKYYCGGTEVITDKDGKSQTVDRRVYTSIDLGCRHKGNAITDMVFAIIRLLSNGVGIIVVGSLIVAGIQYTMSKGDPNNAAKAIERIRNTTVALLIYIFAYAILNFLIPRGFFQ